MKATKFIVIAAALIGLIGFFLPLVKGETEEWDASLSGFSIMKGIDKPTDIVHLKNAAQQAAAENFEASYQDEIDKFAKDANDLRPLVFIVFGPTLLLLVLGGVAAARGKFERLGGVAALILGAISSVLGAAFMAVSDSTSQIKAGPAAYLMMVSGIVAGVAGLISLIKPDRGGKFG
jgi:hypothetical protein